MIAGINIWSGTKGLGGALTNPTCLSKKKGSVVQDYPVVFRGETWPDAEAAYQHWKSKLWPLSFEARMKLLQEVVEAKLRQHPRLLRCITDNGGVSWLEQCWHKTWARTPSMQAWEGQGRESPTIRVLIAAYEAILKGV